MKRLLVLLSAACLGPVVVLGQCDLLITSFLAAEGACPGSSEATCSATWTGGTPPFAIHVVPGSGAASTNAVVNDQSWMGIVGILDWDSNASLTVTDALGCVASAPTSWINYLPFPPQVWITDDCLAGGTLWWSGLYATGNSTAEPTYCPGPFWYNINGAGGFHLDGPVGTDWVLDGSNWRYLDPLPPGGYAIDILPNVSASVCFGFGQAQCFVSQYVVVSNYCGTNFQLRAALGGPLPSGTLMNDQLRSQGLIPGTEPFSALGYVYIGTTPGAALVPSLLSATGNNAIVDWVLVELRSSSDPSVVLHSRPALIQRDGDVVGHDGTSFIHSPLPPGNYHVALRHRNHLGVMTANAIPLTTNAASTMVDFRLPSTVTYGTNARTSVGSVLCLWPGDTSGDGELRYTGVSNDRDLVLQAIGGSAPTNVVSGIYDRNDVDLDGSIRYAGTGNDRDMILVGIGGVIPTATRQEQMP